MTPEKLDIDKLFADGHIFYVPFYQRAYVWNEQLWNRFLHDMEYISCHEEEYFMGSVILKKINDQRNWSIVDGQQRLTTLAIFYKVLSLKCPNLHNPFDKRFRQDNNDITIHHSMNDKTAFETVANLVKDEELDRNSSSKIFKAYNYFRDNLDINKIDLNNIRNRLWFIAIYLEANENEHKIFDTINSIGLSLNTEELLKNHLFTQDTLNEYQEIWKPVFEADDNTLVYWKKKTSTKTSAKKSMSDRFFHTLLQIVMFDPRNNISSEDKKDFRVFDEQNQFNYFQQVIEQGNWNKIDFAHLIASYAKLFKKISDAETILNDCQTTHSPLKRLLLVVYTLSVNTAIPYIMYVLENANGQEEADSIFTTLESYLVRRYICKASSNNYSDLFTEGLIGKRILTNDALCEYLKSKKPDTKLHMPYDNEVAKGFRTNTSIRPEAARCILYLIEANLRDAEGAQTILKSYSDYTLEHLMPQKWRNKWPIPKDLNELEKLDFESKRNKTIKYLGNMGIITQELNSSISNSDWKNKLSKGLKEKAGDLITMRDVISKEVWNEKEIESRSERLAEYANDIWENYISAGEEQEVQTEKQNDKTLYSLDDGETVLSKTQFVYSVVKVYLSLHPEKTMVQLKELFNDAILKKFKRIGFLCTEEDFQNKRLHNERKPTEKELNRWYRRKPSEMLKSSDGIKFAVSTQITADSAEAIKQIAEKEGISVTTIDNTQQAIGGFSKKRPQMDFVKLGLQIGQTLTFKKDNSIKCTIASNRTVNYQGEDMSLTKLTIQLLQLKQAVQPSPYWLVNGKKLSDIYDETYPMLNKD